MILPQCLKIERDESYIFVKTATAYWDYNNVFPGYSNKTVYRGNTVKFKKGCWTFSMIKDRFTYELGTTVLKANNLSKFGELLGFEEDAHIEANDILKSPNKVEINRGLRYITILCDLVSSDMVISPLPITTMQSLKNTISHYTDIESCVPIDKGSYDRVVFSIELRDNNVFDVRDYYLQLFVF